MSPPSQPSAACSHTNLRKTQLGWICADCGSDRNGMPVIAPADTLARAQWMGLPVYGLLIWALTLPIALVVAFAFPFIHFIASMLGVLCHETGHTLVAYLTGHPAIPSFDLMYGGGVTWSYPRTWWLVCLVFGGIAALGYQSKKSTAMIIVCAAAAAVIILLMMTGWDDPLRVEMGHGAQLLASGIFLYRALSGSAIIHRCERWIYGFLGWSIGMDVMSLCWSLITSDEARLWYDQGKPGIDGDFKVLAESYMNCSLQAVATMNLVFCALVPVLTLVFYVCWKRYLQPIVDA